MELLSHHGAEVDFHDPYIPAIPSTREHPTLAGVKSVKLKPAVIARYDAVLICTDHDSIDYAAVARNARLVVDTRNATRNVKAGRDKIVPA